MEITKIETIHIGEFANILFVQIHTDSGMIGLGETYYTPQATSAFIHEIAAPLLIGRDPINVEGHWHRLYEATHVYGNRGNEMRAISAIDVALWDLLGQQAGLPIYRVLGGASRDSIRVYNTCAGTLYARDIPGVVRIGSARVAEGHYEDLDAFLNRADTLA